VTALTHRSDAPLVWLGLAAIALVLGAPVAGRAGLSGLADALMILAAAAGAAAFALATVHTFRAARRGHAPPDGRTDP
jgi:hypothetical protein